MTIEELINRVFSMRDAAQIEHWTATGAGSYARHVALGEFYDEIIDKLDTIVEAYQGYFGLIGTVQLKQLSFQDYNTLIADEADAICKARSEIARGNPAIENLIDGLAETYFKTFYKLANLK